MDLTKFLSDLVIVMVATAAVVAPRVLVTYLAVREQKNAEEARE